MSNRIFISFWLFGLVNNVLYVVILSAAVDLVGPLIPKATVLMADVLPSFLLKLASPFFIHLIPYHLRICMLVGLSFVGMVTVSFSEKVPLVLFGIVLASMSSGLGETTFLQLTHYYTETSLSAWSSGTGGAGLVGAFVYMVLTTWLGVNVQNALLMFSIVPFTFIFCYFKLLPPPGIKSVEPTQPPILLVETNFQSTIRRIKPLVVPFMLPLFTVYVAEYIINQGISPTLLFPIEEMPFKNYRDAYVTYGTLYQLGVFISRSSGQFVRIQNLTLPAVLQLLNLVICLLQSMIVIFPNIYWLFFLIFYEGLLGGSSYVNTFMMVTAKIPLSEREFAMGCVGISDSAGIVVAATIAMFLEPSLCSYQVARGREYCLQ
ncbi:hypothetical protein OGAPHI_002317 [Ogataea philodendri]|uniref:Protein BTN n=1 Tax=Ogataea philodendri TaxID=1378263 RepID=A0A9P8PAF9_9ASCO|nr:uncharacterized protein OGAPHI_002317 [Ogataea philodendri]KAH3668563.1 hypothetical protein OGAPHI_002317 [Ogataea philodendri]